MNQNLADKAQEILALSPSVTVSDAKGNFHSVIAAKRIDSFRVLVIHKATHTSRAEFVVHTFNEQDGGFHHGHYCDTLERANEIFAAKSV